MRTRTVSPLPPDALRKLCDASTLAFETIDDLPPLQEMIGQPRAYRALELGSEIQAEGYNIFVLGLPGSGKTTLTREFLERKAASLPIPSDWCYVSNFANPYRPHALQLPAGQGKQFHDDMQTLVKHCKEEIPRALENEAFVQERSRLLEELKKTLATEVDTLSEYVKKYNFILIRTPFGFILTPAVNGEPLSPQQLETLSVEQREKLTQLQAKLQKRVEETFTRLQGLEHEARERIEELVKQTVLYVIAPLIESVKANYAEHEAILAHIEAVKTDILANLSKFQADDSDDIEKQMARANWLQRYTVNVIVGHAEQHGAPVILETQPTYNNLIGRIEHELVMGGFKTDFTMIRAGAFHRANGGYLILPARDVLLNPYAWEGVKRVLRDKAIRIIELGTQLSLISSATLEPEPIPLDVTVVLIGTPLLYYLLRYYDEDFAKLFKVKAEFATQMERTPETEHDYALFVKSVKDEYNLPSFDRSAVARIIEYGARLAEDQDKLSTRFGKISDLVREAAYWAQKEGQTIVKAAAVNQAIMESIYRNNLIEERLQELIDEGVLLIDTKGKAVGQVNALSVVMLGDYAFGHPSKLTASAFPGKSGVVDIERKAELGGPIHTKGVLILSGFLGKRYGRHHPLTLSASIAFEQSYQGVEGDSASAAELIALLSAIAEVPLRQDIAITGSINQHGQIQAIGGVNEKIEGFFAVCKQRRLTGQQGVIIPASNVKNLMLNDEVVNAVANGKFHIWPVTVVDEALALLTESDIGKPDKQGIYPAGTFNAKVVERLEAFTKVVGSLEEATNNQKKELA